MKRALFRCLPALLLVGCGSGPAQAELIELRWGADGAHRVDQQLAPKGFVEVCGTLDAGISVRWEFTSTRPLDFNIHFHVGQEVVYPKRLRAASTAADRFETEQKQDYCWMWTNPSQQPVRLTALLQR